MLRLTMPITAAEFVTRFPEFEAVEATLIETKLADAQAAIDLGAFASADLHAIAVYYYGAHLLALSPFGLQLQLRSDDARTVYGDHFARRILPLIRRRGQISGGGLP